MMLSDAPRYRTTPGSETSFGKINGATPEEEAASIGNYFISQLK